MYYSSREEAVLVVIGGGTELSVCQRVDEARLPTIATRSYVILYIITRRQSIRFCSKGAPIQVSKLFCDTGSVPVIAITLDSSETIDRIMSGQMIVFMNISQLLIVLIP